MKNLGITLCAAMAAVIVPATSVAQDKVEGSVGADFVSSYIWRGQNCGHISVQPGASLSYKGLSLAGWGSVGFDADDVKEFDLTLSYSYKGFTVGVTDYWFDWYSKYFSYGSGPNKTSHTYEANLGYDFGPVSLNWYTNLAGNDGYTSEGKRAYSSYFEIGAPFRLAGLDFKAELGVVPYHTTYYADYNSGGFAVTNIGLSASKDIKVTNSFSLPLFVKVIANPSAQKAYFVAGFSL